MITFKPIIIACLLSSISLGCADAPPQDAAPTSSETVSEAVAAAETTRIEGWWELGDSAGPFSAGLRGDDVVSVDRNLSHGEYGSTRDRFEFESGRLARYSQNSELRLMDRDDPSRLVPVSMWLEFGGSGDVTGGEKTVDGSFTKIESSDVDRVLTQVDPLIERTLAFAEVLATAGETVRFSCPDERSFAVTFADEAAMLDLGAGWGRHILKRQPSASGAKYVNEVFVFWTKGNEALVERFGESYLNGCSVVE